MKKTANALRAIMNAAHAMTRDTLRRFPGISYRATFAAALKIAHAEAVTASGEWEAMTGDEKSAALIRMVWYAKRREAARFDRAPAFESITTADDAAEVAHGAYIALVTRYLSQADAEALSLRVAVYTAVCSAARKRYRDQLKHASALKYHDIHVPDDTRRPDEAREAFIAMHADPTAERFPAPEAAAITADKLNRACADDLDRQIIALRRIGYTQAETADKLQRPQQTIAFRLKRIAERYHAAE